MFATVKKIDQISEKFSKMPTDRKYATNAELIVSEKAPGAGEKGNIHAHHQGIFKLDGDENYIITGNVKNIETNQHDHAYLYIINNGKEINYFQIVVDEKDSKKFTCPGGIQVSENILAVVVEDENHHESKALFYDIGALVVNEEHGLVIPEIFRIERKNQGERGESIGIIKRKNQWFIVIQSGNSLDVYLAAPKNRKELVPIHLRNIAFDNDMKSPHYNHLQEFQSINLYMDEKDDIYLFGMPVESGVNEDKCSLYKFHLKYNQSDEIAGFEQEQAPIEWIETKRFYRNIEGPCFCYAASIYPEKDNLIIYSIEGHVTDGKIRMCKWGEKNTQK